MTRRALLVLSALAMMAALDARPARAQRGDVLAADAGLEGLVKAGRWMPVRVTVQNPASDLTGELIVDWGEARARRRITVQRGTRRRVEMYLRTTDVRDLVRVQLVADGGAGGRVVQRAETTVKAVPFDERLVVCLATNASAAANSACSATLPKDRWPSSWRGYDAADEVMAAESHAAIDAWRAIRALDESGMLTSVGQPDALDAVRPRIHGGFAIYLLTLPALFVAARRLAWPTSRLYASVSLLIGFATTAALAVGHGGPGSAVAMRHAGTVYQLTGAQRSYVTLRSAIEFPADDSFELRSPLVDAAFDSSGASSRGPWRQDEAGYPMASGRFALGARRTLTFEGVGDGTFVELSDVRSGMHVANKRSFALTDCRVVAGFSERAVGTLAPGAAMDIDLPEESEPVSLTCSVPPTLFDFVAAERRVVADGRLRLVVPLRGRSS